ncbi:hypothetical protein F4553_002140 [Allocatelliglobosispora scoriae]|uniref:Uncharacterized protein n=1 Tax=Allocatelliglobosispora scoriae TaxID=643052 RepID=A0A841BPK3_9ACTN|nr:hypothetical protein [Allocatelliglobosispora scoriae]MBB5868761.1 hypothetical protein [Allocatelliglobosispora scoriae]
MKSLRACVAALAIATLGVLASPAAPAQAYPSPGIECYTIIDSNGNPQIHCIAVGALQEIDWCKGCPWAISFKDDIVFPETFDIDVIQGVENLSLAAAAADPRVAARFHDAAIADFASAARGLGKQTASPGPVGVYDTAHRKFVADNQSWLAAAGQDLADGLALLQKSFGSRDSAALVKAATAEFDEAFKEISGKQVIGG